MAKLAAVSAAMLLAACASNAGTVTGTVRDAIAPQEVVLYADAPAQYEVIGFVSASRGFGLAGEDETNAAVEEMRRQAAAMGANGIIVVSIEGLNDGMSSGALENEDESVGVVSHSGYANCGALEGRAIYVPDQSHE